MAEYETEMVAHQQSEIVRLAKLRDLRASGVDVGAQVDEEIARAEATGDLGPAKA